jgi:hypothetical protein
MSSAPENITIEGSKFMPAIEFHSDGQLQITGRIIPDHITDFFLPLKEWIEKLTAQVVRFEINVEYINSCGLCEIINLFKALADNKSIHDITAVWYYEEEDEEHHEKGLILAERFDHIHFQYISYI